MRVLIIHTYYKLKGGEDSVVANETELLRANGVTVEQLSFNNSGSTFLKLLQLPFNVGSYRKTLKKIGAFKPDVVHIHNLHFSGSAAVIYAIKKLKVPIVMTLHNYRLLCPSGTLYHQNHLFLDSLEAGFSWKAVKQGVYRDSKPITFWLAASMYLHEQWGTWKAVDRFILLGDHSKALFARSKLSALTDKMVVKPNFCYALPAVGVPAEEKPYYLYIGRLTEEKGIPVLLEAFAALNLPLHIVGTGPLEDQVKEYSINYSNINFSGEQPKEKIYELLEGAAALIFPSVWYETFGMVVIEAFSKGVPVIASDLGNIKNMVTQGVNGLRFEAGNANELAAEVSYFESLGPVEKQTYRDAAKQSYVDHYSPEANAAQLIRLYQAIAPDA